VPTRVLIAIKKKLDTKAAMTMRTMSHFTCIATLLLLSTPTAVADDVVIDLSKDLEIASLNNPGAQAINATAALSPEIRTCVVLEKGKIVASYARDDVDPDEPFQEWSITKSWMSLLFGILTDENVISLNETLGEIFPNDTAWIGVNDTAELAFKKNITIYDLLTMTSGLVNPAYEQMDAYVQSFFPGGDGGGGSLSDSLAYLDIVEKGIFSYVDASNILSYVIKEKTGMSPREYSVAKVLPSLGMTDSEIGWWKNADGMEFGYHGLELTATQMAKLGQLYLQGGLSAPDMPLISKEWATDSTTVHVQEGSLLNPLTGEVEFNGSYGYFFWIFNGTSIGVPNMGEFYCAIGIGGQDICVRPDLGRVSVQQRDYEDLVGNFITSTVGLDETVSFDAVKNTTDGNMTMGAETSAATVSIIAGALRLFLMALTGALL
jgi:CubicO group peptidase (beta-lactamase class C family)